MKDTVSELPKFYSQAGSPVVGIPCHIGLNCWPRVSSSFTNNLG